MLDFKHIQFPSIAGESLRYHRMSAHFFSDVHLSERKKIHMGLIYTTFFKFTVNTLS